MRLAGESFEEPLWGSCTGPRQQEGWGCRCLGCGEARTWCPSRVSTGRVFVPAPQPLDSWPCPAVDTWPRPAQRTVPGERPRAAAGPGGPEGRPRQKAQPCAVRQVGSPRAPWGGAACSVPPRRRGAPGAPTGGRRLAQPSCCADSGTAPASFSSGAGRPGTSPRCPAGARGVRWGAGLADPRAAPPRLPPALRPCSRWCPRAASGPRVETVGALPSCSAPSRARAGSGLSRARGL